MTYRIIPRSEWGARYKDGFGTRAVRNLRVYLHHSVTQAPDLVAPFTDDYAAVRNLEGIGQNRFGGGISYTYAITPAGLIFQGHSLGRIGAHTGGMNSTTIGVVFVGNYDVNNPTPAMLDALAWLLNFLKGQGAIINARLAGGHRDVKATSCPGSKAYAKIGEVNRIAAGGSTGGGTPAPTPTPVWTGAMGWPVLYYGMIRNEVGQWQQYLKERGYYVGDIDNSFGLQTKSATEAWQRDNGLVDDAHVGPASQTKAKAGTPKKSQPAKPSGPTVRQENVVSELQVAVGANKDWNWGPDTDKRLHAVRWSSAHHGRKFPWGVRYTQQVVRTPDDGDWGRNSIKAHDQAVIRIQKVLKKYGYYSGNIDGLWQGGTDAAFVRAWRDHSLTK